MFYLMLLGVQKVKLSLTIQMNTGNVSCCYNWPCNEVRLVNSHHSNRFSGAETMKHGRLANGHRLLLLQLPFIKISQV